MFFYVETVRCVINRSHPALWDTNTEFQSHSVTSSSGKLQTQQTIHDWDVNKKNSHYIEQFTIVNLACLTLSDEGSLVLFGRGGLRTGCGCRWAVGDDLGVARGQDCIILFVIYPKQSVWVFLIFFQVAWLLKLGPCVISHMAMYTFMQSDFCFYCNSMEDGHSIEMRVKYKITSIHSPLTCCPPLHVLIHTGLFIVFVREEILQ